MRKLGSKIYRVTMSIRWVKSLDSVMITIKRNMQPGVHTVLNTYLPRRFRNNYRQLRYRRIPHSVLTDKMDYGTVSNSVNNYDQVFTISFFYTCFSNE